MEKYSQFRDRGINSPSRKAAVGSSIYRTKLTSTGSGIAPFLPVSAQASGTRLPFHLFLFLVRLPLLITIGLSYLLVLQWLPIGSLGKKATLWIILAIPGVWWIDLQIDGVKKGSLAKHHKERLPQPGSIIVSSSTSPIDALYLAAIFDPVFTASYPSTRQVQQISLFQAIIRPFFAPESEPPRNARLVNIEDLLRLYPSHSIAVFPECTTTNGRGILPLSRSLLAIPPDTRIFPISLRYAPADVTTPIPGMPVTFLWNLLSKPTHYIRVRIAEKISSLPQMADRPTIDRRRPSSYGTNYFDTLQEDALISSDALFGGDADSPLTREQRNLLEQVGEALAKLGRIRRVGLGVKEKQDFVRVWRDGKTSFLQMILRS